MLEPRRASMRRIFIQHLDACAEKGTEDKQWHLHKRQQLKRVEQDEFVFII